MPWHLEHLCHSMVKKLNWHGNGLRSIFADHHQLSVLVRNSRGRFQRCKDAAVTPVVDLQRNEVSSIVIQNQADLTRVWPKAAAVDDDRRPRFQCRVLTSYAQTKDLGERLEIRRLAGD